MQKNTKNILPDGREASNQKLRELRDKLTAAQSVLSSNQQEKKTTFLAFSPAIDVSVLRQVSYIRSIEYVFGLCLSLLVLEDQEEEEEEDQEEGEDQEEEEEE